MRINVYVYSLKFRNSEDKEKLANIMLEEAKAMLHMASIVETRKVVQVLQSIGDGCLAITVIHRWSLIGEIKKFFRRKKKDEVV